jgi:hypothetical protein
LASKNFELLASLASALKILIPPQWSGSGNLAFSGLEPRECWRRRKRRHTHTLIKLVLNNKNQFHFISLFSSHYNDISHIILQEKSQQFTNWTKNYINTFLIKKKKINIYTSNKYTFKITNNTFITGFILCPII